MPTRGRAAGCPRFQPHGCAMSRIGWTSIVASFALAISVTARAADAVEDPPNTHNMLVVGTETVFLSHLPMFDTVNKNGTDYTSPHRYQVILQATFHRVSAHRRD